jgi:hypothetical protein
VTFLLVFMASGDHFYGLLGAVLWYLLGAAGGALWRDQATASSASP